MTLKIKVLAACVFVTGKIFIFFRKAYENAVLDRVGERTSDLLKRANEKTPGTRELLSGLGGEDFKRMLDELYKKEMPISS